MIEIIKASAGSGKTYTLAVKYIEYLMRAQAYYMLHGNGWVKNTHRRTLAITFTNNSTNEMKQRIVEALYRMKNGMLQDYVDRIRKTISGVTDESIRETAGRLLEDMLEDWQMVRVSTIDSFFNQVVNAFIRELGIDQTPAVDLDTDAIVEQAVDNMLNHLEDTTARGKALVTFLGNMINESIGSGKKWSVRPALVNIAKFTLTDSYRTHTQQILSENDALPTPDMADALKKSLRDRVRQLTEEAESIWTKVEERILNIDGVTSYCMNAVQKHNLDSTALLKCLDDPNAWFKKKNNASPDDGPWLTEKFNELIAKMKGEEMSTCKVILDSINYTGVIAELDREVELVCRENDSILISSTNQLINEIVGNSSTPFIYEKTGLGTDHYMIDEFQDTSAKQWSNFLPLISESNSMDKESLIVGDVKQSIYRWRNGDWRILQNGIADAFPGQCNTTELDCNYRSCKQIVDFNNTLYSKIAERFSDIMGCDMPLIYGNVRQVCGKADDRKGSVRIVFADGKKDDFQSFAMRRIIKWLNELNEKGESGGSAILVRKNAEAQYVAKALAEAGIRFVSTESLLVGNDICVRYITAAMEYVQSDADELVTRKLMSLQRCISDSSELDTELLENLRWLPLDQITMTIVRRYGMDTMDNGAHRSFVFTLADIIRAWTRNNDGNTARWLEYWAEKSEKACVPLPPDDGAVVIMTIHKSKGLQFDNVALLMNSRSWQCGINSKHAKMVSVSTPQGLCEHHIKRVFVNINKGNVKGSLYENAQTDEWEECCIDELNTMYVATTRAKDNILVVGNKDVGKEMRHNKNFCMVNLLEKALEGWGEELVEEAAEDESPADASPDTAVLAREHGEPLQRGEMPDMMNVQVPKSEEQQEGIEKHAWLASIRYEDEVCQLDDWQMSVWENVKKHGWFSRDWDIVLNECGLAYNGKTLRPDRIMLRGNEAVVVDWKFGQKSEKYASQVRGYCDALRAFGYNVTGYLYYAETDETETV